MSEPAVMPKSEMLRRSMRCFILGWWSLIPVLGVVPALLALWQFRRVAAGTGSRWNAASLRLIAGAWLAGIGLLITVTLVALIVKVSVFY